MDRRQKALIKRIASIFVPLLILIVVSLFGTAGYFAYRMVHPERRAVINTPEGYQQILKKPNWDEKTWAGAGGTQMTGWLLYHNYAVPVIILSHGYGYGTRYGHLSGFAVKPGQRVRRGDVIGYVGSTGRSTGPHLHYEVRLNDQPMNPLAYILN